MRKFTLNAIPVISFICFILGIFMIIAGFGKMDDFGYIIDGFCMIFGSVFALGFGFVVEAACKYIERCEMEDEGAESDE